MNFVCIRHPNGRTQPTLPTWGPSVRPSSRSPLTMFRNSHARAPRTTWGPPFRPKRKNFSPPNRPRSRIDMRLPGSDAAPWTSRTDARPGPGDDTLTLFLGYCLRWCFSSLTSHRGRAGSPSQGSENLDTFHTRARSRAKPLRFDAMGGIFKDRASLAQIARQSIVT